ncbi:zinc-finger domain-containing protein [Heyndrickxia acidiproducens]|uniref:zinc-finger domain-containing protein n=1 Tax=Heyndrickxia acidiproducens TaxID=1121084 RepID=UPI000382010C|nr:zinc-finger domain-containing protein [Heyndrickxia acidiproducens]
MERKQLIQEVDEILNTYCKGCLLKAHFRKEYGKKYAHQFCIRQCTVGEQLKKYGEKLS